MGGRDLHRFCHTAEPPMRRSRETRAAPLKPQTKARCCRGARLPNLEKALHEAPLLAMVQFASHSQGLTRASLRNADSPMRLCEPLCVRKVAQLAAEF